MEELDLKELFDIFWNKKIQIIAIVSIFIIIGMVYTMGFITPVYTSSTTLVLATADSNEQAATTDTEAITTTDLTINSKLVSTYSELVKSKKILRQVISNLGIEGLSEDALRSNVTVEAVKDTELIKISVTNENPTYAARIANEIANVFKVEVAENIYKINNVHLMDEAEIEDIPSNINHAKDVIIFAFVGLAVAIAYVLVLNMLDTTIKTQEDIERLYKLPVLVGIPIYETNTTNKEKGGKKR